MPDLWPDEFGQATLTPPVAHLREQGEHLAKRTKGLVLGESRTTREGDRFIHHFVLRAPVLDNYTYVLLTIKHPVEFYPLDLAAHVMNKSWNSVNGETEFLHRLAEVLESEQTKTVVRSLQVQSEEAGTGPVESR